jgi:hypothetical protein
VEQELRADEACPVGVGVGCRLRVVERTEVGIDCDRPTVAGDRGQGRFGVDDGVPPGSIRQPALIVAQYLLGGVDEERPRRR